MSDAQLESGRWYRTGAKTVAVLFVLAVLVRVVWLAYARPIPWSDYEDYRTVAEALLDHGQFGYPEPTGRRLPGQVLFLASMMLVSRSVAWLSFGQVVVSSLIVVVVCALAWILTGGNKRVMVAAGIATAVNPTLVAFAPVLASEHLATLLVLLSVLVAVRPTHAGVSRAVSVGALAGASILTRGDGLFFVPVLAALLGLGAASRRDRYLLPLVFGVICILVVTPWYLRNARVLGPGAGLSTNGGLLFYYAHNPSKYGHPNRRGTPLQGLDDVAAQRRGFQLGLAYLREKPIRILEDTITGTRRLYAPSDYAVDASVRIARKDGKGEWRERQLLGRAALSRLTRLYYVASIALAPVALVSLRRYPFSTSLVVGGLLFMNWVCYSVVFMGGARYRFTSDVILSALAGGAAATLWRQLQAGVGAFRTRNG